MKISDVLKQSQLTRKQTKGQLINYNARTISEIEQYCALGALACEKNLFVQEYTEEDGTPYLIQPVPRQILRAYDIIDEVEEKIMCDHCGGVFDDEYSDDDGYFKTAYLSQLIIHFNDIHEMSFEEIGNELEDMGY